MITPSSSGPLSSDKLRSQTESPGPFFGWHFFFTNDRWSVVLTVTETETTQDQVTEYCYGQQTSKTRWRLSPCVHVRFLNLNLLKMMRMPTFSGKRPLRNLKSRVFLWYLLVDLFARGTILWWTWVAMYIANLRQNFERTPLPPQYMGLLDSGTKVRSPLPNVDFGISSFFGLGNKELESRSTFPPPQKKLVMSWSGGRLIFSWRVKGKLPFSKYERKVH